MKNSNLKIINKLLNIKRVDSMKKKQQKIALDKNFHWCPKLPYVIKYERILLQIHFKFKVY